MGRSAMVMMDMSHRYSTGTLVSVEVPADMVGGQFVGRAKIEIRGKVVDAVVEPKQLQAFRLAAVEMGVGADVLMELEGTWVVWTVHHVADSAQWAEHAPPRYQRPYDPWLDGPRAQALAA